MKTSKEVPPNFGSWYFEYRLVKCNLTQNDVTRASGLRRRSVINAETGITQRLREDTIKGLGLAIGMSIVELSAKIDELKEEYESSLKGLGYFDFLLKTFTEIDDYIRHLIRSIHGSTRRKNPEIIKNSYLDLLYRQISQRFPAFEDPQHDFPAFLSRPDVKSRLRKSLPKEDLSIEVSKGFDTILFSTDKDKLSLNIPELLWDCICKTPGAIDKDNCRIHSHRNGKLISQNFSKNVKIKYEGLEFYWRNLDAIWPPSIDSFFFVENILKNTDIIDNSSYKIQSILDIGAGTGFLGIVLSNLIKGIKELYLSDWTTTSYLYSTYNWHHNIKNHPHLKNISYKFLVAANTYWDYMNISMKGKSKFDLIICNPPYLPIPEEFSELRAEQTTAGTELLEHVIGRSKDLGNITIIQFSHLAEESAQKEARKHKVDLIPIGKPNLVPFRVKHAFENKKYLEWLLDENAEGKETQWALIPNKHKRSGKMRHKYYHYIQTYFVES